MSRIANDLLNDASFVLVDSICNTTLGTFVSAGSQTFTPGSLLAIYVGAILIVGSGATQEVITVTAVSGSTVTASFQNAHLASEALYGATFPAGQPNFPLYTQAEVLTYAADAQKDFLLQTRLVVSVSQPTNPAGVDITLTPGQRYVQQPEQALRVERCAINGMDLLDTSQSTLDAMQSHLSGASWPSETAFYPKQFFQDSSGNEMIGLFPVGNQNTALEVWFSDRGPDVLQPNSVLTVPDVFYHFIKYRILQRCFEKDGEQRSPERAQACERRYSLGVMLGQKFMTGVDAMLKRPQPKVRSATVQGVTQRRAAR